MGSILIVESDPDTSDAWSAAMNEAGHAVLLAPTMREALAVVRDGGIDVVVIDAYQHQISPRDSRSGIVELARGIESLPDAPPIVLVSSSPNAPEVSARIGAATFLPKPCETSELLAAIGDVLGRLRPVRMVHDSEPIFPLELPPLELPIDGPAADVPASPVEIDDEPTGQMSFG
ncbi:MAG: response regulator [Deltaproteobacteria bacterium]|nr:response regulator [Deltaproteobacteria bacterium]MCW5801339.1 response regulator [Deltaproteobacteria bacterium]